MSWVRIWVHFLFSTKNREHFLNKEVRQQVFEHIKQNAAIKGIWLDSVNGSSDHAHCLLSLGKYQSMSEVAQLIKGESSNWINKNKLTIKKFNWQDDYWAVEISESHVDATRNYILNQETHHQKRTFAEELEEFMKKYGWEYVKV